MQYPLVSSDESRTRVPLNWMTALLVSGALWISCGGSPDGGGGDADGDGNSSDKSGQPTQVAEQKGGGTDTPVVLPKPKAPEKKLPLPATAKHLPKDAAVIVSIKTGNLMKKGDYAELLKAPIFADLMGEIQDDFVQGLIEDPAKAGLDVDQPLMIFADFKAPPAEAEVVEPLVKGGIVASLKDADTLKALVEKLIEGIDLPIEIKPVQKEGYTAVAPPGMPAALGYSKDTLIILIDSDPAQAAKVAGELDKLFQAKDTLAKDSNGAALLQRPHDVAAWLDYSKVLNTMLAGLGELGAEANPLGSLMPEMIKDMEISATLRFEPGKAIASMGSTYNAELYKGEFSKGGLDKGLLGMVPGNAILAGTEAFNFKPIRDMLLKDVIPMLEKAGEDFGEDFAQQVQNALGLTFEELLTIPKGDFLLVFDGLVQADELDPPMPNFLIGMTIDNKANLQKLLDNPAVAGGLAVPRAYGMDLTHNEKGLFFYSANHAKAVNDGRTANPAAPAHLAVLANDIGGYVKFGAVVALINRLAADDPDAQQIIQVLSKLDQGSLTGTFGKGTQSLDAELTFLDKKTNGLKQLVDLIKEIDFAGAFGGALPEAPQALAPQIEIEPAPGKDDE